MRKDNEIILAILPTYEAYLRMKLQVKHSLTEESNVLKTKYYLLIINGKLLLIEKTNH